MIDEVIMTKEEAKRVGTKNIVTTTPILVIAVVAVAVVTILNS